MLKAVTTQREPIYIATGYRDNKKGYRTNKYASGGSLPNAFVMKLHKIIETNEWALLNGVLQYIEYMEWAAVNVNTFGILKSYNTKIIFIYSDTILTV